ncbi:hypothetical protein GCM10028808_73540 [Spirosoma migulaei]
MEKAPKLNAEKEEERKRFLDFIGEKPDLTELADKTGILRNTLYYITKGERDVSIDVHRCMAKAYPGKYDLIYMIMGIRPSVVPAGETVDPVIFNQLQSELERVRIENEFLKQQRDQAATDKANYWKLLENMHEQQRDFSSVNSQATDTLFPLPKLTPTRIEDIDFESAYNLRGEKKPVNTSSWKFGLSSEVDIAESIEV